MYDDVINRSANRFWIFIVHERRRICSFFYNQFVSVSVYLIGGFSGLFSKRQVPILIAIRRICKILKTLKTTHSNEFFQSVQNFSCDRTTCCNAFYFSCIFNLDRIGSIFFAIHDHVRWSLNMSWYILSAGYI